MRTIMFNAFSCIFAIASSTKIVTTYCSDTRARIPGWPLSPGVQKILGKPWAEIRQTFFGKILPRSHQMLRLSSTLTPFRKWVNRKKEPSPHATINNYFLITTASVQPSYNVIFPTKTMYRTVTSTLYIPCNVPPSPSQIPPASTEESPFGY